MGTDLDLYYMTFFLLYLKITNCFENQTMAHQEGKDRSNGNMK